MAIPTWPDRVGRDVVTVEGSVKRDLGATRHFLATPSRPVFLPNLEGGPAVANLWSTRERVAGALGIQSNDFLPKLLEAQAHPQDTRLVEHAEFMTQATSDVDLTAMPIPKLFPKDAGRDITAGVWVAERSGVRIWSVDQGDARRRAFRRRGPHVRPGAEGADPGRGTRLSPEGRGLPHHRGGPRRAFHVHGDAEGTGHLSSRLAGGPSRPGGAAHGRRMRLAPRHRRDPEA